MDRRQRHSARASRGSATGADSNQNLRRILLKAGIPGSEMEAFLKWSAGSLWKKYKKERMDNRLMIENEVKGLGIRLPNGTVNKDYQTFFNLPTDKITNIDLEGAEELGLLLAIGEDGRCSLSGRPLQAGDFNLKLRFDTVEGEPPSEIAIPIAFNPDPRLLWKNIPTDENITFYKPDSEVDYVKVEAGADGDPRKDIVAASQRGRSHAQEGRPRDDHFRLSHCGDSDWYVIAVADGAGSAKFSRKGSEVACNTVVDHCRRLLLDNPEFEEAIVSYQADRDNKEKRTAVTKQLINIIYYGAVKAHEAVKGVAVANEGSKLKDFATTLMFAICKKYDFGWFIASFWVGDGAMCLFDREGKTAKLLGTPDEGEFSGQTRFLTMPEIFHDPDVVSKRLRMAIVDDFTALFLMTDGVSDPMFETEKNLSDYGKWEEFYEKLTKGFPEDEIPGVDLSDDNEASKEQLLKWLDFWSPGNHDDRTIAVLY